MNEQIIIDVVRQGIWTIIKVAAPILIVSMVIGLVISILQTVTSIQEQTLTFVPKLIGVFLVIMLAGNWIMTEITEFTVELFSNFSYYINML